MWISHLETCLKRKTMSKWLQYLAQNWRQAMRLMMAGVLGSSLLGLAGMNLTATMSLPMTTLVLVLLTPILVPAAAALSLVTSGFMFSGSCARGALGVTAWMYRHMTGNHPFGADQLDVSSMHEIVSKGQGCEGED